MFALLIFLSDQISWRRYYFLGKSNAQRSKFLGNMNAAMIFPSDQISCNTGRGWFPPRADFFFFFFFFGRGLHLVAKTE